MATDYTPIGPVPSGIANGTVDATSRQLARDMRGKAYGKDVRETIARMTEWHSIRSSAAEVLAAQSAASAKESIRTLNDTVRQQTQKIDNMVVDLTQKDFDSAPEVISARRGKASLGAKIDEVDAQLEQKASKSEVRRSTDDQPIDVDEMNTRTKQLFTGGAVAVVGEHAVGRENVKPKAIDESKTTFINVSTNLYNHSTSYAKKGVRGATGVLYDDDEYTSSEFIPINPSTQYTTSGFNRIHYYDENMVFILAKDLSSVGSTITSLSNAFYVRLHGLTTEVENRAQINMGSSLLPYEPYYIKVKSMLVEEDDIKYRSIGTEKIKKGSVTPEETTFVRATSNLYDESKEMKNHIMANATGQLIAQYGWTTNPEYIYIEGEDAVSLRGFSRVTIYNQNKGFARTIDLLSEQLEHYVLSPNSGESFIRVSYDYTFNHTENRQVNVGSELLDYEVYGYHLKDVRVPFNLVDSDEKSPLNKGRFFSPAEIRGDYVAKSGEYKFLTLEQLYSGYENLINSNPEYYTKTLLGKDTTGTYDVFKHHLKPKEYETGNLSGKLPKITFIANIHGGEYPSALATYYMVKAICEDWKTNPVLEYLRHNVEFVFIPVVHPYGYVNGDYSNSTGVNLQTNFPHNWMLRDESSNIYGGVEPLTEIETVYVKDMIDENLDSTLFVDLHSAGYSSDFQDGVDSLFYFIVNTGQFYNQDTEYASKYAIESNTRLLKKNYPLITTNNFLGWVQRREGQGTADAYASSVGIPSSVMELFYNLPYEENVDPREPEKYSSDSIKATSEVLVNNFLIFLKRFKDVYYRD